MCQERTEAARCKQTEISHISISLSLSVCVTHGLRKLLENVRYCLSSFKRMCQFKKKKSNLEYLFGFQMLLIQTWRSSRACLTAQLCIYSPAFLLA